ncbi:uncharacterized protein TRIADDRAFT_57070 [Trichoplax adhaerens]|uniref:TOG domain-containing protein n=1 Tax=Trichoplax adhaerens TaxID=10228 RepID=B3S0J3_TRIAD|nr:hypothetical protein TRIADDRAFT_57070 [Trichoplax adhaerens]EDV24018.1 hypothetical protein TRIADDRAFT_57070 [Trichoplax adhaerens]|eukprot:XP_002113544.1 hypothetical protein TRIADDRAFT_57070 [Trichoplax adhaerens]
MVKPLAPIGQKSPTNLFKDSHEDSKSDSDLLQHHSSLDSSGKIKDKNLLEKHSKLSLGHENRKKSPTTSIRAKKLFIQDGESSLVDRNGQTTSNELFYPSLPSNELSEITDSTAKGLSLSSTWPKMTNNEDSKDDVNRVNSLDRESSHEQAEDSSPLPMKPKLARSAQRRKKQLKKMHYDTNSQESLKTGSNALAGNDTPAKESKSSDVNRDIDSRRSNAESTRSQTGKSSISQVVDSGLGSWTGVRSQISHDSGELSDTGSNLSYFTNTTSNDIASNASYGEQKLSQNPSSLSNRSDDSTSRTSSPPVPALAKKLANTDSYLHFMADFGNSEDNLQTYPSPSNKKLNPRRKLQLHDETITPSHKNSSEDYPESISLQDKDDVMVVGHKMLNKLGASSSVMANYSANGSDSRRNSVQQVDKNITGNMPSALVGKRMRNSSQDGEMESPAVSTTLSKVTQERLKAREQPRLEKVRQRKADQHSSRLSDTQAPSTLDGHAVGARTLTKNASNQANESAPSDDTSGRQRTSAVSHSSAVKDGNTVIPVEELKPVSNPEAALRDALKNIANPEWETKHKGITLIRRLCQHHSGVLTPQLHSILVPVVSEVKNLRSQIVRNACVCLKELFNVLGKQMDQDLDLTTKTLICKASDTNVFLWDDAEKALKAMVAKVTPTKCVFTLINEGSGHKNAVIRKATAALLEPAIERLGVGRLLGGPREIAEKVIPVIEKFTSEGSSETRYYAKSIICKLIPHPEFEKHVRRVLPDSKARHLMDIAETLSTKGLGSKPTDTPSAKQRQSQASGSVTDGSRLSRFGSAGNDAQSPGNSSVTRTKRSPNRTARQESQLDLPDGMLDDLVSQSWTDRSTAIEQLVSYVNTCNISSFASHIVKVFDKFTPRLTDSMSKVNIKALGALQAMIPRLREHLGPVMNSVVPALASNLASKKKSIHDAALQTLHALVTHLDNTILIPSFANASLQSSIRSKPEMIEKLSELVKTAYDRKPQLVTHHVLPVIWDLLGGSSASASMRSAVNKLCSTAYSCMGNTLLETAKSQSLKLYHAIKELLGIS